MAVLFMESTPFSVNELKVCKGEPDESQQSFPPRSLSNSIVNSTSYVLRPSCTIL